MKLGVCAIVGSSVVFGIDKSGITSCTGDPPAQEPKLSFGPMGRSISLGGTNRPGDDHVGVHGGNEFGI